MIPYSEPMMNKPKKAPPTHFHSSSSSFASSSGTPAAAPFRGDDFGLTR